MPDPKEYETEANWMEACVSAAVDEGRSQEQAVAMCLQMWRSKGVHFMGPLEKAANMGDWLESKIHQAFTNLADELLQVGAVTRDERIGLSGLIGDALDVFHKGLGGKDFDALRIRNPFGESAGSATNGEMVSEGQAVEMPMLMTKAEKMADGRIRWQARANCGKVDLEGERFDTSFWGDVTHNFNRAQEAISKGESPPDKLPVPILDIAHYSFRLAPEKRNLARAGYPIKVWVDGTALMAQGYFDDTPLGRAAAKAATTRPVSERRISIGVWPDWGRVELTEDGHRIYKGGRNRAYLDHLAITACPVDPGTVLEVKSMTQKQDAIDELGGEAAALVDELEAATTKAMPDGVVIKAEETEAQPEPQPEAKAEAEAKPAEESSFSRGDME